MIKLKKIPGYDEAYFVDYASNVYDKDKNKLQQFEFDNGYVYYKLNKKGVQVNRLAHILGARAFIPNPEKKKLVNHKDLNKSNPHCSNLAWCTHSENQQHWLKMRNGGIIATTMKKEKHTDPAEKTWEKWTIRQRIHFLEDHKDHFSSKNNHKNASLLGEPFSKLPSEVKDQVKKHIKDGKYSKGGTIKKLNPNNKMSNGGTIDNAYYIGNNVSFKYGRDKEIKNGIITGMTPKGDYIISSGTTQSSATEKDIIGLSETKKRKKVLGIFKDGGNVELNEKIEKEISELHAEIKKNEDDMDRYAKNIEDSRLRLQELLASAKHNEELTWHEKLTESETSFIINALNRYGTKGHPTATQENLKHFKPAYIVHVLNTIEDAHLSATGMKAKTEIVDKLK